MKIFVGNLSSDVVENDLLKAFEPFGEIERVNIARSALDGNSRGFGYVDIAAENVGNGAIAGLNGTELNGRTLKVVQAHRRTDTN